MPLITIRLYPPLSEKAGAATLEAEGTTAGEALRRLGERLGPAFGESLFEEGKPRHYFTFVLNRRIIEPPELERESLRDGDILQIHPPIAGG